MSEPAFITRLVASEKRIDDVVVMVGQRVVATLPLSVVMEAGLKVGQAWDGALAARVKSLADFNRAVSAAMKAVGRRPLSIRRLEGKMRKAGHDDDTIARVVERMKGLGALDDEKFGRALVAEIQSRKPAGPALLRAKLQQRGLEQRLIAKLLRETAEDPARDAVADARELARKKLRGLSRLEPVTRKRRLWGMLARRGFDSETISTALSGLTELSGSSEEEF